MRKLSLITLGVSNLERSIKFYEEALDLEQDEYDSKEIAFFNLDGPQLALFPRDELAKDAGISPEGNGFQGITLAHNVESSKEVLERLQIAVEAGGALVKAGQAAYWGGFSGYLADPDGYLWEIACGSKEYAKERENT
jgi:catechol 2,3-dioxygenase-like lactoylglutathione lyase family enzyme